VTLSQKAKEMAAQETMVGKNPKEVSRTKMVDELNRRFFETRLQKPEVAAPRSEEIAERVTESAEENLGNVRENVAQYEAPQEPQHQRLSIEA
jgi:histidinol dehydrogenase